MDKLDEMRQFLEERGMRACVAALIDYCIDTAYEGDYNWEREAFADSFRKYAATRAVARS